MNHARRSSAGYTFVELVVVLVLLGILAALALPSVRLALDRFRGRAALNRIVAEIYRTRMLAVKEGGPTGIVFRRDRHGCVTGYALGGNGAASDRRIEVKVDLPGLCLSHSGDSVLVFNSRGLLRPPTRSFHVSYGSRADSVLLSIAGRVRRSYRRRRK